MKKIYILLPFLFISILSALVITSPQGDSITYSFEVL
jgi:hypothetical protein